MAAKVLIVEDSQIFREQIVRALKAASLFDSYLTANDGLEGLKLLLEERPDLVISDLQMPHLDGLRLMQMTSARPEVSHIPFILLTGGDDRDARINALEQGASDYLNKPFDPAELVARVRIHLRIKKLQDELKATNEQLKQLATVDPLTTLFNRRFLNEMLDAELLRAKRLHTNVALLLLDIDHFKSINDRFGHQAGDKVLVVVADTLRSGLRNYDIASRYGGEEFVLLLPGSSLAAAREVAERLRRGIQRLAWPPPMQEVAVTVSIGVSLFSHDGRDSADALFSRADEALYLAKNKGRNRVEVMMDDAAATAER